MTPIASTICGWFGIAFIGLSLWFRHKGVLKSTVWTIFGFLLIAGGVGMLADAILSVLNTFPAVTVGAVYDFLGMVVLVLIGLLIISKKGFKTRMPEEDKDRQSIADNSG